MGREEAAKLPSLMSAPKPKVSQNLLENDMESPIANLETFGPSRAVFRDGVFMAVPFIGPIPPLNSSSTSNSTVPQQRSNSQYVSETLSNSSEIAISCVLDRFDQAHHHFLAPQSSTKRFSPLDLPSGSQAAYESFSKLVQSQKSSVGRLAATSLPTIYHLLRISSKLLRSRRLPISHLGPWIWALLARVPPIDEMTNDDVSVLRTLGKLAVQTGTASLSKRGKQASDGNHSDDSSGYDEFLRRRRNTSSPLAGNEESLEETLRTTVEMIVVVVSERFGQKDMMMMWETAKGEYKEQV
jgi:hypothetical protein